MSEAFLFAIEETVWEKLNRSGVESLTRPERVFFLIWELEGQVNNGGFSQYLFNRSGNHATEAPSALDAIGARRTASIAREALAVFRDSDPPRDQIERRGVMGQWIDEGPEYARLNELDHRFYAYEENLSDLLSEYVQQHAHEFG